MANKRILLGILVLALVFGMTVVGCDDEPGDWTVTFDANGGKWEDGSTTKTAKVPDGTASSAIGTYVREPTWQGHTFRRWESVANPDPNIITGGFSIYRDCTFYAYWRTN